jgi:hypothetical protein
VNILGIDAGTSSVRQADHLIHELIGLLGLPDGTTGCTHLIHRPPPHVAISLTVPAGVGLDALPAGVGAAYGYGRMGPPDLAETAALAAAGHLARTAGRAVVFPGVDALAGTVTVAETLRDSSIGRVVVLGAPDPEPGVRIETRGHIRPEWRDGVLTLVTTPAADGTIAPFEMPNPTPCCADHA